MIEVYLGVERETKESPLANAVLLTSTNPHWRECERLENQRKNPCRFIASALRRMEGDDAVHESGSFHGAACSLLIQGPECLLKQVGGVSSHTGRRACKPVAVVTSPTFSLYLVRVVPDSVPEDDCYVGVVRADVVRIVVLCGDSSLIAYYRGQSGTVAGDGRSML